MMNGLILSAIRQQRCIVRQNSAVCIVGKGQRWADYRSVLLGYPLSTSQPTAFGFITPLVPVRCIRSDHSD